MNVPNLIVYISVILTAFLSVYGKDCLDSDISYIHSGNFDCLIARWNTSYLENSNRWACPEAASAIRKQREWPLKKQLISLCQKKISNAIAKQPVDSHLLYQVAQVCAIHGIQYVAGTDIFTLLTSRPKNLSMYRLASLGDVRAIPYIAHHYQSLRREKLTKENREKLISYLNCLYHISDFSTIVLASQLEESETDSLLKERIKLIIYRNAF